MSFTEIQKAFDVKLKQLSSAPYIAWPNTSFKPANYTCYIKPTLLLANTDTFTLDDYESIPGIYQVSIFSQLNRGVQNTNSIADEIRAHFYKGLRLTEGNTFIDISSVSKGSDSVQEAWYTTFVEINFLSFNI